MFHNFLFKGLDASYMASS